MTCSEGGNLFQTQTYSRGPVLSSFSFHPCGFYPMTASRPCKDLRVLTLLSDLCSQGPRLVGNLSQLSPLTSLWLTEDRPVTPSVTAPRCRTKEVTTRGLGAYARVLLTF